MPDLIPLRRSAARPSREMFGFLRKDGVLRLDVERDSKLTRADQLLGILMELIQSILQRHLIYENHERLLSDAAIWVVLRELRLAVRHVQLAVADRLVVVVISFAGQRGM